MLEVFRFRCRLSVAAAGLLVASAGLVLPLRAAVAEPAGAPSPPAATNPDARLWWQNRAAQLRARVVAADLREQTATAAYSRMLTRRYPAGEAKQAILDEREAATKALAEAHAAVREFKRDARASEIPDRWIDPDGTPPPWWVDPES